MINVGKFRVVTRCYVLILIPIVFLGCDGDFQRVGSPPVVSVDEDDERLIAAIEKAKATWTKFEQNWQQPGLASVSIKVPLKTTSDDLEHIWFTPIAIDGDQIRARCANQPENIPGLKFGDIRTIDRSEISDWMIMDGDKCYGGYTIRVMAEIYPDQAPPLLFADYP